MDAVEYIKERTRMCESVEGGCGGCRFSDPVNGTVYFCNTYATHYPEEAVRIVEEWSKAHPVHSREQKFEEVFGHKPLDGKFNLLCPPVSARKSTDCYAMSCSECKNWWKEPYVEPKGE